MDFPTDIDIGKFGIWVHPVDKGCVAIEIGKLTVYFSFRTPIAFRWKGKRKHVCENVWGKTTEKHMGFIEAGSLNPRDRIVRNDFEKEFKTAFSQNIVVCANELLKERIGIKTEKDLTPDDLKGDMEHA